MMDREKIKEIMQSQGILPQSKFGQNFLCDEDIIRSIVRLCGIREGDTVIEIGPGLGSITVPISELPVRFYSYEIDKGLAEYLKSSVTNVTVINKDFLKVDISESKKPDVVVSNIPYYIMTDIMKKLFGEYSSARRMVFMVEDEAVARIDCGPCSKQYGPLAILCSLYGSYNYEFKVPYTAFVPQPRTTSAVISFERKDSADILCDDFVKFLNACFSMRRKMLKKNLAGIASADAVSTAFLKLGINENARAEELTPEEFAELYTCFIGHL